MYDANDSDFRFAFYDTATNYELIVGMNDFGPPGGTGMRMRADDNISTEAEIAPPGPFVPGNYGNFASGPTNFASGVTPGAPGIQLPGMVNHFVTRVTRTSETLLDCRTYWTVEDTIHKSASLIGTFNEASPPNPTNVPPSGHFTQLNGFGFVLLDLDPFNNPNDPSVTSGSYEILNFVLRYCAGPVTVESSLRIISVVQDPGSGDITITWESENGVDYDVLDSADLSVFGTTPIDTVSATGPTASYTIPGATVTANGKRFYKIRRP